MKLLIVFLVACTVPLEALKCYECHTLTQKCDNIKNEGDKFVVDCPGTCAVAEGKAKGTGTSITSHFCHPGKVETSCGDMDTSIAKGKVCYCNEDKCNSSDVVAISILSMFALVFAGAFVC